MKGRLIIATTQINQSSLADLRAIVDELFLAILADSVQSSPVSVKEDQKTIKTGCDISRFDPNVLPI